MNEILCFYQLLRCWFSITLNGLSGESLQCQWIRFWHWIRGNWNTILSRNIVYLNGPTIKNGQMSLSMRKTHSVDIWRKTWMTYVGQLPWTKRLGVLIWFLSIGYGLLSRVLIGQNTIFLILCFLSITRGPLAPCFAHLIAEDMSKSAVIEEKTFKHSPWAGADNPLGPKFWCQQVGLITMVICCKFTKNPFNLFSWLNKCI